MELNRITIENNEEFLRQISTDVNFINDDYSKWIEALKDYCQNNAVYALAPVQIGIPKRMIYFRNTTSDMTKNKDSNYDESTVLINPVIIEAKGHTRFIERFKVYDVDGSQVKLCSELLAEDNGYDYLYDIDFKI